MAGYIIAAAKAAALQASQAVLCGVVSNSLGHVQLARVIKPVVRQCKS
jgi:hypothetical protein